jgi:hypothetical protein
MKNRLEGLWNEPIPAKSAFLAIFTSIGVGVAMPIYAVIGSDLAFLRPPFDSHFLDAIILPVLFLIVPAFVLFMIQRGIGRINAGLSVLLVIAVISTAVILWGLRLFHLATGSHFPWLWLTAIIATAVFIVVFFLRREFMFLFVYGSVVVGMATVLFVYRNYTTLSGTVEFKELATQQQVMNDVPVFIFVFDELPVLMLRCDSKGIGSSTDGVNGDLYPNFKQFADDATWYVNSTSGVSITTPNVQSLISGLDLLSDPNGAPPKNVPNLIDHLAEYRDVLVWESKPLVATGKMMTARRLSVSGRSQNYFTVILIAYSDAMFHAKWIETPDLDIIDQNATGDLLGGQYSQILGFGEYVRDFLDQLTDSKEQVAYFYSLYPHHAYIVNPDGSPIVFRPWRRRGERDEPGYCFRRFHADSSTESGETIWNIRRSMINQIRFTDGVLGALVGELKGKGIYDEALIIVFSDHGIGFTDAAQGRDNRLDRTARHQMDSNLMNAGNVLMVKYPHQQEGAMDPRHARPHDIARTICEVLGVSPPWQMDGQSLITEDWQERKSMFIVRNYGEDASVIVEVADPATYELSFPEVPAYESRWLGVSDDDMPVRKDRSGQILYVTREASLPWESGARYIMTVSGYSYLTKEGRVPDRAYISVNGTVAKVAIPSQFFRIIQGATVVGDTRSYWAVRIPPDLLHAGKNVVRVFNPTNEAETEFVEARRSLTFEMTKEEAESFGVNPTFIQ